MTKHQKKDFWEEVENCLEEKTTSGYKMALIEADKILFHALDKAGYPGNNTYQKVKLAKEDFSNYHSLNSAIKIKDKILNEVDYNLSSLDIEESLDNYKQAIIDVSSKTTRFSFLTKIKLKFLSFLPTKFRSLKWIVALIFLFFLSVLFFSDTKIGQKITKTIVKIAHFIFGWFMVVFLIIAGILVVVIGSFFYFDKRQGREL